MSPHHPIGRGRAVALAGFLLLALGVAGFGMLAVSRRQWRVQATFLVRSDFDNVGGLNAGDRVRLQGLDAGVVEAVEPPDAPGKPVRLVMRVDDRLRHLVRADAVATIVSEGVVGARVVEIVPGEPGAAPLPADGLIPGQAPVDMAVLLKRANSSLARLDAVSKAAEEGLAEVNAIAATIRKGEGSLGKLVKEDQAYQNLVSLSTRGEKTLQDLEENLEALKQTWPISRYFGDRAYYDRDRVLYQPGSARESRSIAQDELFEPDRAVLTLAGRRRLDEVGAWFKQVKRSNSEVVIAAFTDRPADPELARILTQQQAETVRKYLASKHGIDSAGWFSSRKVAVVGFGTDVPRVPGAPAVGVSPRRVEVIVFTPQA